MKRILITLAYTWLLSALLINQVCALSSQAWVTYLGGTNVGGLGIEVGADPRATDHNTGVGWTDLDIITSDRGAFCLQYHENGVQQWAGETGFYAEDYRALYNPSENKTYANIYFWAQNITLGTPYRVQFHTGTGNTSEIPTGYTGHLVLDYVPTECNWDGPMDFWLDLGKRNYFDLPTIVTTDPLQGTRMHLTVYAPVPEPASLAALAMGLAGIGGLAIRRRR